MRVSKADSGDNLHGHFRLAYNDFISNETRNENSLKFVPLWCEAFVITAISSTFGAILTK